jgi:PAS domain S-box-containing protein
MDYKNVDHSDIVPKAARALKRNIKCLFLHAGPIAAFRIIHSFSIRQRKMHKSNLYLFLALWIGVILWADIFVYADQPPDEKTVYIGVLARRGPDETIHEWQPTAQYLTSQIPGHQFEIKPLRFDEIIPAVNDDSVDFIITNSSTYVTLNHSFDAIRLATLKRTTHDGYATLFGGSIFCKADRNDVETINDLAGKSFMAVNQDSFGGWLAARLELKRHGIDPYRDFTKLQFGGTHDAVVYAVLNGIVDAGTVATPILENMIIEGKIEQNAFRIINHQQREGFPFLSTELYPEWPIAKLKHTSSELAEQVTVALLSIYSHDIAAKSAQYAGWTVALDYTQIDNCLKELRYGIYENYGKITFEQIFSEYRWQSILCIATILLLICLLMYFRKLNHYKHIINHELNKSNYTLQQSKQQLATILDFLPDATFVVDNENKVIFWNKSMEEMSGVKKENIIGLGDFAYTVPLYGERRKEVIDLLDEEDSEIESRYIYVERKRNMVYAESFASALNKGKGAYVWIIASPLYDTEGNRVGSVESIRDITEKKEAEEDRDRLRRQLIQSQKMESIGTLAGGIAHDFNNILGAIIGYTDIAKDYIPCDSIAGKSLSKVTQSSQRAAMLVKQILAFSRQDNIDRTVFMPKKVIKEAIDIIAAATPSTIEIKENIAERTKNIYANRTQIHQIVVNLSTNACHAMEQKGGILQIELQDCKLLAEDLIHHPDISPGDFVVITVSDTGIGIAPDLWGRIFDPYFTTKEVGKGSGMGLSIIHGIVTECGGFVNYETDLGHGSVFRVYFPAVDEAEAEPIQAGEIAPTGNERVMFVDDEPVLVEMGQTMLEQLGYSVSPQTSSATALDIFRQNPSNFDLVITDQTMPGLTGLEFAKELLKIRPDLPIIICTGYSATVDEDHAKAVGIKGFGMKPLGKSSLAVLIRQALDDQNKGECAIQ